MASFTPRQVAVRAQEAASQLLAALDRDGLVAQFLNSYAKEEKRPGRTANPERYRELLGAIRREALLVMVIAAESRAPALLGIRSSGRQSPAQTQLLDLFREEFFVALGRALEWNEEDFDSFSHDLELFRKLYASAPHSHKRAASFPQGPFVDRCGLLLDSAMIDQARRAAAKFESELVAASAVRLKRVFSNRSRP